MKLDLNNFDQVMDEAMKGRQGPLDDSPVGARHDQGRSKASIRKGKQRRGSRKGRQDCHKTEQPS